MLFSEISVWVLAITVSVVALFFFVVHDETTKLTMPLHAILTTLSPY